MNGDLGQFDATIDQTDPSKPNYQLTGLELSNSKLDLRLTNDDTATNTPDTASNDYSGSSDFSIIGDSPLRQIIDPASTFGDHLFRTTNYPLTVIIV